MWRLNNDDLVTAKGNNSFHAGYISHAYFAQDDFDRRVSISAEQMLKRQEKKNKIMDSFRVIYTWKKKNMM